MFIYSATFMCLFVCLFVLAHDISKTDAARITKFGIDMDHHKSWKYIYFGIKWSKVKVTGQKHCWRGSWRCCECCFFLVRTLYWRRTIGNAVSSGFVRLTDRHGLVEAKRVDDLQNRVLDALRDHCTYNAAGQRLLFARAIGLLPQLRTVSRLGVDRLRSLKHRGPADQPAAITPDSPELLAAPAAPLQSPL